MASGKRAKKAAVKEAPGVKIAAPADAQTRLAAVERRLDALERELRLLSVEGAQTEELRYRETLAHVKEQVLEAVEGSGMPGGSETEERSLLADILSRLDEARNRREDIVDVLVRIVIAQEVQNSRTKLLFLAQKLKVDSSLFDDLDQVERMARNPYFSLEELRLRWSLFEERATREMERLKSG